MKFERKDCTYKIDYRKSKFEPFMIEEGEVSSRINSRKFEHVELGIKKILKLKDQGFLVLS